MTDRRCEQIEELLVYYADEQLPADRQSPVEAHLAGCESCRRLLAALRESGTLARAVWQQSYDPIADLQPADVLPRRRRVPAYAGAAAAAIVLALLAGLLWRTLMVPTPQPTPEPATLPQMLTSTGLQLTPEQVRRDVDAAGASTALLASVDWLAEQPANREIARQQYEFIVSMYAGTEAAEQAQARLTALQQRSS
jgi:anti-sigma factor RsiW